MGPYNRKRRQIGKPQKHTNTWTEADKARERRKWLAEYPIAELNLNVRIVNTLEEQNIILLPDLLRQSYAELMQMRNFGDKTLSEVVAALKTIEVAPPDIWKKPPRAKPASKRGKGQSLFGSIYGVE